LLAWVPMWDDQIASALGSSFTCQDAAFQYALGILSKW
jgi:hypothetical protein